QRPLAPARQALRDLEVSSRGGIDLHKAARQFLHRGPEERQPSTLREVEVLDDRAERGQFRPVEASEGVERSDFVERAKPFLRPGAVEGRTRQGGHGGPGIRHYSSKIAL